MVEDDSYALFLVGSEAPVDCDRFYKCDIVAAPFTTGIINLGKGWMFQKRSPFLKLFKRAYRKMEEAGTIRKMEERLRRERNFERYHLKDQICSRLDGSRIGFEGANKSAMLFALFVGGVSISQIIFAYVYNRITFFNFCFKFDVIII